MKIQFRSRLPSHNLYTWVKFCTHRSNVNLYKVKTRIAFFCLQDITQKYVFLRERKLIAHFSAKFCVPSFCIIWSKLDLIVAGPQGFPGVRRWSRHPDRANWESHCGCKLYGGQGLILCFIQGWSASNIWWIITNVIEDTYFIVVWYPLILFG